MGKQTEVLKLSDRLILESCGHGVDTVSYPSGVVIVTSVDGAGEAINVISGPSVDAIREEWKHGDLWCNGVVLFAAIDGEVLNHTQYDGRDFKSCLDALWNFAVELGVAR